MTNDRDAVEDASFEARAVPLVHLARNARHPVSVHLLSDAATAPTVQGELEKQAHCLCLGLVHLDATHCDFAIGINDLLTDEPARKALPDTSAFSDFGMFCHPKSANALRFFFFAALSVPGVALEGAGKKTPWFLSEAQKKQARFRVFGGKKNAEIREGT